MGCWTGTGMVGGMVGMAGGMVGGAEVGGVLNDATVFCNRFSRLALIDRVREMRACINEERENERRGERRQQAGEEKHTCRTSTLTALILTINAMSAYDIWG